MGSAVDPKGQPLLVQQNRYQPDTALPQCPLWIVRHAPGRQSLIRRPQRRVSGERQLGDDVKIRALESASCAVGEDVDLSEAV
jgi:hypothetical protein